MPETPPEEHETPALAGKPLEKLVADIDWSLAVTAEAIVDTASIIPRNSHEAALHCIKFSIDDILFGVPLSDALEIGHRLKVTPLPNLPNWVIGVTNARGEIISIVALNAFFGISAPRLKRNQRFIILHNFDMKVGILADHVFGIVSTHPDMVEEGGRFYQDADTRTRQWSAFVSGIFLLENEMINVLDVSGLLDSPKMNAFRFK